MEILELVACGLSNREIGQTLFVSENTVKTHCSRAFDKFGAAVAPRPCSHEGDNHVNRGTETARPSWLSIFSLSNRRYSEQADCAALGSDFMRWAVWQWRLFERPSAESVSVRLRYDYSESGRCFANRVSCAPVFTAR
jgi:Bacterial regulatory proteins, luxR family